MNTELLNKTKQVIENSDYPKRHKFFAGANLIITNDPNRNHHKDDILVVTQYANEISWLIYQLKEIFSDEIDYGNKYTFYPYVGEIILKEISKDNNLNLILKNILQTIEDSYG